MTYSLPEKNVLNCVNVSCVTEKRILRQNGKK